MGYRYEILLWSTVPKASFERFERLSETFGTFFLITKSCQRQGLFLEGNLFLDKSQVCRCFPSAADVQLIQNIMDVVLDGPHFDHEMFSDLLIGLPFANQLQNFEFAGS